jgi:hypothetical protein
MAATIGMNTKNVIHTGNPQSLARGIKQNVIR